LIVANWLFSDLVKLLETMTLVEESVIGVQPNLQLTLVRQTIGVNFSCR